MRKFCLLLIVVSILLVGCVSTNVQVNPDIEMSQADLFYIARYDDSIGLHVAIEECFLDYQVLQCFQPSIFYSYPLYS